MNTSVTSRGFTIVELLIVIVVIAILAAISIVAYTGIQNRAHNTALQSDLRTVGGQILLDQTLSDSGQPATADATGLTGKVKVSKHSYNTTGISSGQFAYCRNNEYFALLARSKTNVTYVYRSIGGTIGTVSNTGNLNSLCASGGVANSSTGYAAVWLIHPTAYAPDVWAPWVE